MAGYYLAAGKNLKQGKQMKTVRVVLGSVAGIGLMVAALVVAPAPTAQGQDAPAGEKAPVTGGTPSIKFDSEVYDFGKTSRVSAVTGTFTFTNVGDGVLTIQRPNTSCGCTVAGVKPETVKPGEKGELTFTLNVGNIRGHTEKTITVPSNDPKNPMVKLTIKADVQQIFELQPSTLYVGDIRMGEETNLTVSVKRTDGEKLKILKSEMSSEMVSAEVVPGEDAEGQTATINVKIKGVGQARRFGESLRFYAEETPQPSFTILASGRLMGDLAMQPEVLVWPVPSADRFPGPTPEATTTRRIKVTSTRAGRKLELSNVAASVPQIKVEVVTLEEGQSYEIIAKLPEAPQDTLRCAITFDTNFSEQPKAFVPVTVTVLKR
jgi:hypothetical protein